MQDFEASREQLWIAIRQLQRQKTLPAIRQARLLLREWMKQHPDDYYTQDAGESLAMMEEALEIIEAEKSAEPVAA
jgi:hypothetical protein